MIHSVLADHRGNSFNKMFQWMKKQEIWILDSILLQHIKIKKSFQK